MCIRDSCRTGENYQLHDAQDPGRQNNLTFSSTYRPLGKNNPSSATAYSGLPFLINFSYYNFFGQTRLFIYDNFAAFQSANLTQTTLPEVIQIELKLSNGQSTLRDWGRMTYNPNQVNGLKYDFPGGVDIKLDDIVEYTLYRRANDNSEKEMIFSCNKNKTYSPPLEKMNTFDDSKYGLYSHYQSSPSSVVSTSSLKHEKTLSFMSPSGDAGKYVIREHALRIFSNQQNLIQLELGKTFLNRESDPDNNKYFAKVYSSNNSNLEKEIELNDSVNDFRNKEDVFPFLYQNVSALEIYAQAPNSSPKNLVVKFSRTAFPEENGGYFSTDYDKNYKNIYDSLVGNIVFGEDSHSTKAPDVFTRYSTLDAHPSDLVRSLVGETFSSEYYILPSETQTMILQKTNSWYANNSGFIELPESLLAVAYDINGKTVEKNIGKMYCNSSNCNNLSAALPIKYSDIIKVEVYRALTSNPERRKLIFSTTTKTPISVSLETTPESGKSTDLFKIKASITDPSTEVKPTTYTFWWNCDSKSSDVSEVTKACGQPRVRGQEYTKEQRLSLIHISEPTRPY
jgi:hypothetical protein